MPTARTTSASSRPFVDKLREGYEFVMGSRFKGTIEPGSMPWLHRYLGTPVTTWILNRVYSSKFSDIHCGMRGITLDALQRMDLQSAVVGVRVGDGAQVGPPASSATTEVPVRFLKDREGGSSHHKRAGWFSPWQGGVDQPPGHVRLRRRLLRAEAGPRLPGPRLDLLAAGQLRSDRHRAGHVLAVLAVARARAGNRRTSGRDARVPAAKIFFDYTNRRTARLLSLFAYTRATFVAAGLFVLGVVCEVPLVVRYFHDQLPASCQSSASPTTSA